MAGFIDNSGAQRVVLYDASGLVISSLSVDTELPAAAASADGSNPTAPSIFGMQYVYNGTSWDRNRGVITLNLANATAYSVTTGLSASTNWSARGLLLAVKITAVAGDGSIKPSIQYQDLDSAYTTIWTATAAQNTVGTYVYALGPGFTSTAGFTEIAQIPIPRTWRVNLIYAGSGGAGNQVTVRTMGSYTV